MHKGRLTIIVQRDPPRNILRDSEIAVHPALGGAVPTSQARQHRPQQRARHLADTVRAEIGVELIPGVAHGREAIAEMPRASGDHHRFRRAVTGADDEVVGIQVELLNGHGEKRQVLPIELAGEGQPVNRRLRDQASFNDRGDRALEIDQREQVRGREELAKDFKRLLPAAHAGDPVVDEGDAHVRIIVGLAPLALALPGAAPSAAWAPRSRSASARLRYARLVGSAFRPRGTPASWEVSTRSSSRSRLVSGRRPSRDTHEAAQAAEPTPSVSEAPTRREAPRPRAPKALAYRFATSM